MKPLMQPRSRQEDQLAKRASDRIVKWVIGIVGTLIVLIVLLLTIFVKTSMEPIDPGDKRSVAVTIPMGSTTSNVGELLEEKGLIKSATVFKLYSKFQNVPSFQAGIYSFSKADTFKDILAKLSVNSDEQAAVATLLVPEGATLDEIADAVQKLHSKNKNMSKRAFMATVQDKGLFREMAKQYPQLLKSAKSAKDVRYRLEGYLFPATYSIGKDESIEMLVEKMVAKTDEVMSKYYETAQKRGMSVQQVLTLASLVEREASKLDDRKMIAGVFLNRIDTGMPLQSDLTVMYALKTHKKNLTNKDTSVDSPYNLYKNKGYGPGPFNNPSEVAINAVLNPSGRDYNYLYFVANMSTGEIRYSQTLAGQNANAAEFESDNNSY